MSEYIVKKLPRVEGTIKVALQRSTEQQVIYLESGRSTHLENRLIGRYPLEAIHQTQLLSSKSGIAHALAAVTALENYLNIKPTEISVNIRQLLLQVSTIHSHIHHFYWELLPDYLNITHFIDGLAQKQRSYLDFTPEKEKPGDLSKKAGQEILENVSKAAETLGHLQMAMAELGGKYPVVMNLIPGGISNSAFNRSIFMSLIRHLEQVKYFVEVLWPEDIKTFVQNVPNAANVLVRNINLLSFGSSGIGGDIRDKYATYSDGVFIDGKLSPVNELKITESFDHTFFQPVDKNSDSGELRFNFQKTDARTWIRGARYESSPILAGPLSRMLVTHFAGGNMEISDRLGQMMDDLNLSVDSPNCAATRLLAAVFEGRFYLKGALNILLDLDEVTPINNDVNFDFSEDGVGIGKIEAPSGALMHRVFIEENKIVQYRIVSAANWNLSPGDEYGKMGIIEQELNILNEGEKLSAATASRHLHSYHVQVMDGTK
jgi:Ni,Fe-hydrogenase I large subunit